MNCISVANTFASVKIITVKIVITDYINLSKSGRYKLERIPGIKIYDDTPNSPKVIIERLKDAEVATANFIDLTSVIIKSSPKLKYIISPAAGYDWIDVKTANEKNIKVLNCPTYNSQSVAEHALGLMFAVKRRIIECQQSILRGEFNTKYFVGTEAKDKTLITVGHGNIGKRITKMAQGLGMKTKYADSKTTPKELDKLISEADVLVLCLPLNEKTKGIINAKRITLLKKNAIFINAARGLLVDNDTLYKALVKGKILGAGLDTFPKDETLKVAGKDIIRFAKLPNVITTPHVGFNTIEASERLADELISDIKSCIEGKPINTVN